MKNKLLSLIVAGAMAVSLLSAPVVARAEGNEQTGNEASVSVIQDENGNGYDTIQEALKSSASTIILNGDVSSTQVTIPAGKTVVLDLNGKTLTLTSGNPALDVQGSLTIQGNGSLTRTGYGYLIKNSGKLNISGGTYTDDTNDSTEQNGVKNSALICNVGEMTVSGGTFKDSGIVIKNDDASKTVYGTLNVTGGTFECTATVRYACLQNSGKCTVSGGTFSGGAQTVLSRFWEAPQETVITGGRFSNSGTVFHNYFDTEGGTVNTKVSGGTFTGNFKGTTAFGVEQGTVNTVVTGGSFTTDVSDSVADGYCVGGTSGAYTVAKHSLVKKGTEAKCTEEGVQTYYECERCGALFSDEAGNTVITETTTLPATGHDFVNGKCTKCEEVQVQAAVVDGATTAEVAPAIAANDKVTVQEAAGSVAVQEESRNVLASKVVELTQKATEEVLDEGVKALKEKNLLTQEQGKEDVVVYQMVSLKVKAKAFDKSDDGGFFTLDIHPVVQKVVATSDVAAEDVVTAGSRQNAVKVGKEENINVEEGVPVRIELTLPPAMFANKPVYITHIAETGNKYYCENADEKGFISFENPDGFSDFIFSVNKTEITDVVVETPVAGKKPQTKLTGEGGTTGTIQWSPEVKDTFAYGTAYTATVTVTPGQNFVVADEMEGWKVEKKEDGTAVLTKTFLPTEKKAEVTNQTGNSQTDKKTADKKGATTTKSATPKTGDTQNTGMWIVLCLAAAVAMVSAMAFRRRSER